MRFYNTLKRKNEEFIPISGNKVKFYVCGPTVYDYCHMGHARTYVFFDLVRRYLEYKGYTVIFVMNITDVDDKIINRAKEMGIDPLKLSKKFTDLFYEDLALLNIKKANIHPKVSEHMDEIIDIIKDLVEKGFGYEVDGNVYFSMDKVSAFGKLSKQSFDELLVGARVEPDPRKKNPKDFALWKKSKEGEIGWHSPWGIGRPGWHIECSTMSMEYLGSTLDIHGGGMDLIFPHHECEILQSEAYTGKEFVRYWLHTGLLTIDKEKMSKSLGNFFTIKEVLEKYEPDVVRFFLLNAHYRSPLDFSDRALDEARESLERIRNFVSLVAETSRNSRIDEGEQDIDINIEEYRKKFIEYMDDDFDTRQAIALIFEFTKKVNECMKIHRKGKIFKYILELYNEWSDILGIKWLKEEIGAERELIEFILELRKEAREMKEWEKADKIREKLSKFGIIIEDDAKETRWRKR